MARAVSPGRPEVLMECPELFCYRRSSSDEGVVGKPEKPPYTWGGAGMATAHPSSMRKGSPGSRWPDTPEQSTCVDSLDDGCYTPLAGKTSPLCSSIFDGGIRKRKQKI